MEISYTKVFDNTDYTAIQITTASGIMSVVDVWADDLLGTGYTKQENLPYKHIMASQYCVF